MSLNVSTRRNKINSNFRAECHELCVAVKDTVEALLALPSVNVWSMHGGLERLTKCIKRVLKHRLKTSQGSRSCQTDIWMFVRGLRWIRPAAASMIGQLEREFAAAPLQRARQWIRRCLQAHDLSTQLGALVNSRQHLLQHYHPEAYLCQPDYFNALLICLRAVEHNRPALLADVNPAVLCRPAAHPRLIHSRSISLPVVVPPSDVIVTRSSTGSDVNKLHQLTHSADQESLSGTNVSHSTSPVTSYGLYASCNASLSDVSAPPSGCIERLGDPMQNVYITSSVEMQKRLFNADHASLTSLDTLSGYGLHTTRIPSCCSEGNTLPSDDRCSMTSEVLRAVLVRTDHSDATLTAEVDDLINQRLSHLKDEAMHASFRSNAGMSANDVVDNASLQADSGIESRPASFVNRIPSNVSHQLLGVSQTRQSESVTSVVQKRISHMRSVSDVGVVSNMNAVKSDVVPSKPSKLQPSLSVDGTEPAFLFRSPLVRRGIIRQPSEGQSLLSFLSSQDFHTCTDLDRENAHFSIAEALIAAIEQMKWNQTIVPKQESEHDECDSDDEIQQLKQRIRIRRTECLKEKARKFPGFCDPEACVQSTTDSNQSDQSIPSFESLSPGEYSSSSGEENIHDSEINDNDAAETGKNLVALKESGLSLSMASLYSDADLARATTSPKVCTPQSVLDVALVESIAMSPPTCTSADSIAISLLKRFSEHQLPKASELIWLVSADDAPQELLPLPESYPISPDDGENNELQTSASQNRIRGNLDWAPPRAQIIFTVHPKLNRNDILAKQNFRCAGCGSKVEMGYAKRYRYCEYLGKYFCPCCHSNDRAYIPGHILRRWDFSKYYVSHFALDLLRRIYYDPLFSVEGSQSSPSLYRKSRSLDSVRECRIQLFHLSAFINTCTRPSPELTRLKALLEKCPAHWFQNLNNVHIYTLDELVQVKKHELLPKMKSIATECRDHIAHCQLCQAKGFICEMCRNVNDIIFPFDLAYATTCPICNSCYHKLCFDPEKCQKCFRLQARKLMLEADDPYDSAAEDTSVTIH